MPPKKDAKKGKGGPATLKEVVLADFIRESTPAGEASGDIAPLDTLRTGNPINVDTIFPAWTIEGEDWSVPLPAEEAYDVVYPLHISTGEVKDVKTILGIEAVEPPPAAKGKGKGAPEPVEFKEDVRDANGKLLPRVFFDPIPPSADPSTATDGATEPPAVVTSIPETDLFKGYDACNGFLRDWTSDQVNRRLKQDGLLKAAVDAEAAATAEATEAAPGDGKAVAPDGDTEIVLLPERIEYNDFIAERDMNSETPLGPYRDHLMCEAFTMVKWFGKAVEIESAAKLEEGQNADNYYLWRSIYPQLPNGRPAYNPQGKYLVRLFIGGEWRRAAVNDVFPTSADGSIALASSSEPLELWPALLSKAIYLAFNKAGYSAACNDFHLGETGEDIASSKKSSKQAHFVSFAVQCLTGWTACSPWVVADLLSSKGDGVTFDLLTDMVKGGTPYILPANVPGKYLYTPENPIGLSPDDLEAACALEAAGGPTDEGGNASIPDGFATKKQHRNIHQARLDALETLLARITEREGFIASISARLGGAFNECFSVILPGETQTATNPRVLPVLGLVYPEGTRDVSSIQILVDWSVSSGIGPTLDKKGNVLPAGSGVEFLLLSASDIVSAGGAIVGFDTNFYGAQGCVSAHLDRRWAVPKVEEDPKAKKGKGDAAAAPAVATELAPLALTLLKVKHSLESNETAIPLTVAICADLVSSAEEEPAVVGDNVVVILQQVSSPLEGKTGLLLRTELPTSCVLPFTKCTFYLPASCFSDNKDAIFALRVFTRASVSLRVSSFASLQFGDEGIWCARACTTSGATCMIREGTSAACKAGVESLLFRQSLPSLVDEAYPVVVNLHVSSAAARGLISLIFAQNEMNEANVESDSGSGDGKKSGAVVLPRLDFATLIVAPGSIGRLIGRLYMNLPHGDAIPPFTWKLTVLSFAPMTFPTAAQTLIDAASALTTVDPPTSAVMPVTPAICGDVLPATVPLYKSVYTPNSTLTLFRDVYVCDKAHFPFSLKVSLDDLPVPPVEEPVEGEETPKEPLKSAMEQLGVSAKEDIPLIMRIFRKSDGECVRTFRGRSIVQAYNIEMSWFQNEDGTFPAATDVAGGGDAKGKDKGKAPAKGAAPSAGEPAVAASGVAVEMIIHVSIDNTAMAVSPIMKSRLPYRYDGTGEGAYSKYIPVAEESPLATSRLGDRQTVERVGRPDSLFTWQAFVIGGIITNVRHDTTSLERLASLKNAWEEKSEGRWGRSENAVDYYNNRMNLEKGTALPVEAVTALAEALTIESSPDLTEREALISGLAEYIEHRDLATAEPVVITPEEEAAAKESRASAQELLESSAKNISELVSQFTEKMRASAETRVVTLLEQAIRVEDQSKEVWKERETVRGDLLKKNEALRTMLARAAADIEATLPEDQKAAKGKGKKK